MSASSNYWPLILLVFFCGGAAVLCVSCKGESVGGPLIESSTRTTIHPSNGGTTNHGSLLRGSTMLGGHNGSGGMPNSLIGGSPATGGLSMGSGGITTDSASTRLAGSAGSGGASSSSSVSMPTTGGSETGGVAVASSQTLFAQGGALSPAQTTDTGGNAAVAEGGSPTNDCGTRVELCAAQWMVTVNAILLAPDSPNDAGAED